MTSLKERLGKLGDRLVPVAGFLMSVALSNGRIARDPEIHDEECNCQVCRAFLTTQGVINELEVIMRELQEDHKREEALDSKGGISGQTSEASGLQSQGDCSKAR